MDLRRYRWASCTVCRRRSLREPEEPRESVEDESLGMLKMRWKNGFFASDEVGE